MPSRNRTSHAAAKGRLDHGPPIAVIDIGSNSVRLVAYEGLTRSPTPIFNEKVLAGLGREVQSTGLLARDAVERALSSLRRFRSLCDAMGARRLWIIATAACRDAVNGPDFIGEAEKICRVKIDVISGKREAELSALGVLSGIHEPDGLVGDLGGGSLELIDLRGSRCRAATTVPLGGLALQDSSEKSLKKAEKIVETTLGGVRFLGAGAGRAFYSVGGTWRALARLHMRQTGYPLHVMHGYSIPAKEALEFVRLVRRVNPDMLSQIEAVTDARRPLLGYAALVHGAHHPARQAARDRGLRGRGARRAALLAAQGEGAKARRAARRGGRPQRAALALAAARRGADPLDRQVHVLVEDRGDGRRGAPAPCRLSARRYRLARPSRLPRRAVAQHHRACELSSASITPGAPISRWRCFSAMSGCGRASCRRMCANSQAPRMIDRARVLGGALRVAYLISAAMPGILPEVPLAVVRGQLVLSLKGRYATLGGERLYNRLRQLARLIGRDVDLRLKLSRAPGRRR